MNDHLAQEAIDCALKGDWQKAKDLNLQILTTEPQDIDALNRLARAYSELGKTAQAKSTSKQVLAIDPFNAIAIKAAEKWKVLKKGTSYSSRPVPPETFLEEPGKTKVVSLLHLGDAKILAKLDAGDEVILNHPSHRMNILTKDKKYIGRLPDDISARLKKLINVGNQYQAFVKSANTNDVKVFLRETFRSTKVGDTPSFSTEKIDYVSFTPPELVHDKAEMDMQISEEEQ